MNPGRRNLLLSIAGLLMGGCAKDASTANKADAMSFLSRPRSSENSIAVEFAILQVLPYRRRLLREMWNQVDQQVLDLELRKQLVRNGVRAGIAGQALPPALRSIMQPRSLADEELTDVQQQMLEAGFLEAQKVLQTHIRLTAQPGQSRDAVISDIRPELVWDWHSDEGVGHYRFEQAISKVRLTMSPLPGDLVSVGLLPLIAHGQPLPQYEASGDQFVFAVAKSEHLVNQAEIKINLHMGETLVFGPSLEMPEGGEPNRLGDVFFHQNDNAATASAGESVVLIRMLGAKSSDLFGDQFSSKPLVSVFN